MSSKAKRAATAVAALTLCAAAFGAVRAGTVGTSVGVASAYRAGYEAGQSSPTTIVLPDGDTIDAYGLGYSDGFGAISAVSTEHPTPTVVTFHDPMPPCQGAEIIVGWDEPLGCDVAPLQVLTLVMSGASPENIAACERIGGEPVLRTDGRTLCEHVDY